jgi:hypothetical protein
MLQAPSGMCLVRILDRLTARCYPSGEVMDMGFAS